MFKVEGVQRERSWTSGKGRAGTGGLGGTTEGQDLAPPPDASMPRGALPLAETVFPGSAELELGESFEGALLGPARTSGAPCSVSTIPPAPCPPAPATL